MGVLLVVVESVDELFVDVTVCKKTYEGAILDLSIFMDRTGKCHI
jgi:hypothetical protein